MTRPKKVGAVVLAAGASRRLGRPKQLVRVAGHTLVFRAVYAAVAAGCQPVVLVVGARADEVAREVESLHEAGVQSVVCDRWHEGLSASLRCGVAAIEGMQPGPDAIVLLPCDQPALEPGVVQGLIDAWDGDPSATVGSAYAGTVGSPALFGRGLFPRLLSLEGDVGAKSLLQDAHALPWPEGARDVDTPEDL